MLTFLVLLLAMIGWRAIATSGSAAYSAGTCAYETISALSDDLRVERVIVLHRHGDRSQISPTIGPMYPESDELGAFWATRLPKQESLNKMASSASTTMVLEYMKEEEMVDGTIISTREKEYEHLYGGADLYRKPYAMLTEEGYQQLVSVGKELKRRYVSSPQNSDALIDIPTNVGRSLKADPRVSLRSTNMCRTLQSLRALLVGLYDISEEHESVLFGKEEEAFTIRTRPKSQETMFQEADGPCSAIALRRSQIFPDSLFVDKFGPSFKTLEAKMEKLFGYGGENEESVKWLRIKEVLTCHNSHGRGLYDGVTEEDYDMIGRIAAFIWGTLYRDDVLNRLAIGRFIHELLADITVAEQQDQKLLIYSGHDSTLVPILCALNIYDDTWPPYASFLSIEFVKRVSTNEKFVRVAFNDREQKILNLDTTLCPYEVFHERLTAMSLSNDEYAEECYSAETSRGSGVSAIELEKQLRKSAEEVLAATGVKST